MDIVKRLRGDYGVPVPFTTTPICHEAADEIERLRQQNAELMDGLHELSDEGWNCCNISKAMKEIAQIAIAKATGGE